MAGLLLEDGAELAVFDERPDAMAPLVARGAVALGSPAGSRTSARPCSSAFPTPEVVREVACGPKGVVRGKTVRTFVDLSTTGAAVSEEIAAVLHAADIVHLDAPVSGGVAGLEARSLAVMASGEEDVLERVRPVLETFGPKVFRVGPSAGQGQLAKLLNNLLSATAMAVTSEALMLGLSSGLEPSLLLEIFNAGSGRNTATSDKFPRHVLTRAFASGFRLNLMAKDVELCLAEARRRHAPMLVGGIVQQLWTLAASQASEDADHTQLVELYEGWAGTHRLFGRHGRGGTWLSGRQPEPSRLPSRYEVIAVNYGSLEARKSELFYRYESYGEPDEDVEMAYFFWILLQRRGGDPRRHGLRSRRRRSAWAPVPVCPPVDALRALGFDAADVSTLVITHLHYDHVGNVAAFPDAELVVPRKELDFWTGPGAARHQFASHVEPEEIAWLEQARRSGRVRLTDEHGGDQRGRHRDRRRRPLARSAGDRGSRRER